MTRPTTYIMVSCLFIIGCSGDDRGLATVSGTVLFKGKPLPNAGIIFTPDQDNTRVGVGSTDKDRKYRLTSFQINNGAKIGKHTVTIRAYETVDGPPKAADDITNVPGKMITPFKYARTETSDFTADVTKKNNVIDFQLVE